MKLTVIGAGSSYTPEVIGELIRRRDSLPVSELCLMDIDPQRLSIVGGLVARIAKKNQYPADIVQTTDLVDAVRGASFVLTQFRVGQLPARQLDETIPLKYGLLGQETTGIGGFFKALRTIPEIAKICRVIEEQAPGAFLINFTNPSGIITQYLLTKTRVKAIGLCNNPINMQTSIAQFLGADRSEVQVESVGLNHLNWFTRAFYKGEDRLSALLAAGKGAALPANVPALSDDPNFLLLGEGIPCAYLNYFYYRAASLEKLRSAKQCRAEECMAVDRRLLEMYGDPALDTVPAELKLRGGHLYSTAAVNLIDSIHNDRGDLQVVDTSNGATLPFLAPDDVVEATARIDKNGAHIQPLTKPANLNRRGLVQAVKAYERLTVEAALTGDDRTALRALTVHPLVGDYPAAKACFEEMKQAHRAYLPAFFQGGQTE